VTAVTSSGALPAAPFGLPEVLAGVIAVALNAYVLMGGADFGGGVWDLLARGPRREERRRLIARAIGPIWEANHVWLVVSIVVLFTAFPAAFARLGTLLHVPLTCMLIGIVFRGSAFVFRSYGTRDEVEARRWGRVFAIASVVTPLFLGIMVGAIASGSVGRAAALLPAAGVADAAARRATFLRLYLAPWCTPFCLGVGVLAVALFAFLAAVYLTMEAGDDDVREDFRRSALGAAAAVFVAAFGTLAIAHVAAPEVRRTLTQSGWALPVQVATAVAAISAIVALIARRWVLARIAAASQVSFILWGWLISQYPCIVPPDLTIRETASPRATLVPLAIALAGGALLLVPSLVYLFRTFSRSPRGDAAGAPGGD